ncbi:hypothetical protein Tco_0291131 [Tanacetum coccineum]
MVAMPKITREGYYTCNIRVEYECKPPRCACCKVFGHSHKECYKNIGAGEMKNSKKPSQTSRGVPVILVDDEGKPLEKVEYSGDYDSEDEVALVDNEMASFFVKKDGYGNDMYEGQEIPNKIRSICDNLDIKVRGRRKK